MLLTNWVPTIETKKHKMCTRGQQRISSSTLQMIIYLTFGEQDELIVWVALMDVFKVIKMTSSLNVGLTS